MVVKKVLELVKVIVIDCVIGVLLENLENLLVIVDINILRCKISGVNVINLEGFVIIENVMVQNISYGDGFVFRYNIDIMDFCLNIL